MGRKIDRRRFAGQTVAGRSVVPPGKLPLKIVQPLFRSGARRERTTDVGEIGIGLRRDPAASRAGAGRERKGAAPAANGPQYTRQPPPVRRAGNRRRPAGGRRDGLSTHRRRWYRSSSFPRLCLSCGARPRVSVQAKGKGRSNSSSTRQTVSVLPIRPSPLTRGQPPSPSGSFSPSGAKSHKTSMLRFD